MAESDLNSDLLSKLAEEFVQRYRAGERPALSEYTENYPAIADEILEVFPALVMVEDLAPENDASAFYTERPVKVASPRQSTSITSATTTSSAKSAAGAWGSSTKRSRSRWGASGSEGLAQADVARPQARRRSLHA